MHIAGGEGVHSAPAGVGCRGTHGDTRAFVLMIASRVVVLVAGHLSGDWCFVVHSFVV